MAVSVYDGHAPVALANARLYYNHYVQEKPTFTTTIVLAKPPLLLH
jgi:hypothetical protein